MLKPSRVIQATTCSLVLLSPLSTPNQTAQASFTYPVYLSQAPSNEVLEERINSTRTDLVNIVKWALSLTLGLYTVLLGYNFYKSLVLDKQEKENLKEELLKSLKESLRDEFVPESEKKLREELKVEIDELQIALERTENTLIWTRYKLADLSAKVASSRTAYQYPAALQEHIQALVLLQEINTPEAIDLMHYSLKAVRKLLIELAKFAKDPDTAPILTEEHMHRLKLIIERLPGEYATSQEELEDMLVEVRPLLRREPSSVGTLG